mgnify:CR=1 FL=1
MKFELARLSPHDRYKLLAGFIVPRPIAFVSSMSGDGCVNLAPYSFFNAVSYNPPTIVFSSSRHTGDKQKDTLANIEETGEFRAHTW